MAMVKDWRGKKIKVGATVVYPSRQSSYLWMNEGEVVSIKDGRIGVRKSGSTRIAYPAVERLTVLPRECVAETPC